MKKKEVFSYGKYIQEHGYKLTKRERQEAVQKFVMQFRIKLTETNSKFESNST